MGALEVSKSGPSSFNEQVSNSSDATVTSAGYTSGSKSEKMCVGSLEASKSGPSSFNEQVSNLQQDVARKQTESDMLCCLLIQQTCETSKVYPLRCRGY